MPLAAGACWHAAAAGLGWGWPPGYPQSSHPRCLHSGRPLGAGSQARRILPLPPGPPCTWQAMEPEQAHRAQGQKKSTALSGAGLTRPRAGLRRGVGAWPDRVHGQGACPAQGTHPAHERHCRASDHPDVNPYRPTQVALPCLLNRLARRVPSRRTSALFTYSERTCRACSSTAPSPGWGTHPASVPCTSQASAHVLASRVEVAGR